MSFPHPVHNEISNKYYNKELGCSKDKVVGVTDQEKPQIFYFSKLQSERGVTPYYVSPRSEFDAVNENGLLVIKRGGGQKWFLVPYQYYFAIVDFNSRDGEKLAWTLTSEADGTQVSLAPLTFDDRQMWAIHEDQGFVPVSQVTRPKPPQPKAVRTPEPARFDREESRSQSGPNRSPTGRPGPSSPGPNAPTKRR